MKSLLKNSKIMVALTVMALAGLMLAGCSSTSEVEESSGSDEFISLASEESILVLGEETDTALNIVLTNDTDQEIDNIAILPAGSTDDPAFLMTASEQVADGEQVSIFTEPVDGATEFDIVLTMADGKDYTLHDLDLSELDHAIIQLKDDVAYITVTVDGNTMSTFREEYEISNANASNDQAEASTQDSGYDYYYEEPSVNYGGYDGGASTPVDQGSDNCVDGGVALN